jgi:DNA topoisomerase-1
VITVRDGKYGPYVNWGKVNATLPKGKDPQTISVEEALALIAEKAGKAPAGKTKAKPKAKTAASETKPTKTAAKPKAKAKAKAKAPAKSKKS